MRNAGLTPNGPHAIDVADGTVDFVREIFVAQLAHVLADAFDAMNDATLPPNTQLGYAKLAMEAAEKLAGVEGVNVHPRFTVTDAEAGEVVDIALEAAKAVLAAKAEREARERAEALKADAPTATN